MSAAAAASASRAEAAPLEALRAAEARAAAARLALTPPGNNAASWRGATAVADGSVRPKVGPPAPLFSSTAASVLPLGDAASFEDDADDDEEPPPRRRFSGATGSRPSPAELALRRAAANAAARLGQEMQRM